jgi:hypothetical protein
MAACIGTGGLLGRQLRVFAVAIAVFFDYKVSPGNLLLLTRGFPDKVVGWAWGPDIHKIYRGAHCLDFSFPLAVVAATQQMDQEQREGGRPV